MSDEPSTPLAQALGDSIGALSPEALAKLRLALAADRARSAGSPSPGEAGAGRVPARRGTPRAPAYSADEVASAIGQCARELGRVPTITAYERWMIDRRRRAKSGGRPAPRLPYPDAIYRLHPGWRAALAAAGIDHASVAASRAVSPAPGGTPAAGRAGLAEIGALDARTLARTSIDVDLAARIAREGIDWIPFPQGVRLAVALDCYLGWLIGLSARRGQPPCADATFDGDALRRLRKERRISEADFCERSRLTLGQYRRLIRGSLVPTLGQMKAVCAALAIDPGALLHLHTTAGGDPQGGAVRPASPK